MAHYAIGDVQGCRAALEDLLERIAFDPAVDRLYFAGDLVARGPDSLGTLRLIHGLGPLVADSVLGNHDLHLIAVHHGLARARSKDNTQAILDAPDRQPLMDWLQQRHLLLELPGHHVLTHAGIPPVWSLAQARQHAREVEQALRGPDARDFLAAMYGNEPAGWDDSLAGTTRLRVITNFLTRMRLLDPQGGLDFAFKGELAEAPPHLQAWFALDNPGLGEARLLFGHWAALLGDASPSPHVALDHGCVWGHHLCAWRLEDGQRFHSRPGLK